MSRKNIYTFKELKEEFEKIYPEFKTGDDLLKYGVKVSDEDLKYIEILETFPSKIIYTDKRTNDIFISDLIGRIREKYNVDASVSLTRTNQENNFVVEQFNSIPSVKSFERAGSEALKSRENPETKLVFRAYADVSTKYGDFCLQIEEDYTTYNSFMLCNPPRKIVSLYYGNHNQVFQKYNNDFNFSELCIFRWKYVNDNFDQVLMGYKESFDGPVRSIWRYGESDINGKKCFSPIYAVNERNKYNQAVIFMDGNIKAQDNKNCLPDHFNYGYVNEVVDCYESLPLTSKAYFTNSIELVSILKEGDKVILEYSALNQKTYKWEKISSITLPSSSGKFNVQDLKNVILEIEKLPIKEKYSLKRFIINELNTYLNVHDSDDLSKLSGKFTLKSSTFEDMFKCMENNNLTELVENQIENLCSVTNMNLGDFLGVNPPNQIGYADKAHKLVKKM